MVLTVGHGVGLGGHVGAGVDVCAHVGLGVGVCAHVGLGVSASALVGVGVTMYGTSVGHFVGVEDDGVGEIVGFGVADVGV